MWIEHAIAELFLLSNALEGVAVKRDRMDLWSIDLVLPRGRVSQMSIIHTRQFEDFADALAKAKSLLTPAADAIK